MAHLAVTSPVGALTLFEDAGAVVALEWGRAPAAGGTPLLDEARRQLDAYFAGRIKAFDLPLRPRGTPFQEALWRRLSEIPHGQVLTYGALAAAMATAPRAVGGACGRNPIPILIPCHRVVGAGRWLGGYSGGAGLETKRALLRLEGIPIHEGANAS
jgi:methylated-DNA-[protein]-cysteine S-methyltransferase